MRYSTTGEFVSIIKYFQDIYKIPSIISSGAEEVEAKLNFVRISYGYRIWQWPNVAL